jgi:hypothetical protein
VKLNQRLAFTHTDLAILFWHPLRDHSRCSCCGSQKDCGANHAYNKRPIYQFWQQLMVVNGGAMGGKCGQSPAQLNHVPIFDIAPTASKPIKPVAPTNGLC